MNKKILAVILIAALGMSIATGCGKKDNGDADVQTQQSAQADESTEQSSEQTDEPAQQEETQSNAQQDGSDGDTQTSEPIDMTTEELEDLVDTFNNPQSEEEKEAARVKLEAVLKQMEQMQQ